MRALYQFAKLSRLKFVSHLDLQRFMQMALRRTELPVAYSQGFNPHPVMSFASALAVGWISDCEILDVKLSALVSEDFAFKEMAAALPPDMPLKRVRLVDDSHPAMMASLRMAEYRILLDGASEYCWASSIIRDFTPPTSMSRTARYTSDTSRCRSAGADVAAARWAMESHSFFRYLTSRSRSASHTPSAAVRMISPMPCGFKDSAIERRRARSSSASMRRETPTYPTVGSSTASRPGSVM